MKREIFISYSRRDTALVGPLVSVLRATGTDAFQDIDSIPPGARWQAVIVTAIASCKLFLLFWCRHAAESRSVTQECEKARALGKRLCPLLIDSTPLPASLSEYQWIDLRAVIGNHEEREVVRYTPVRNILPGASQPIGERVTELKVPNKSDLMRVGLVVWGELGKLFEGLGADA